MPLALEVEVATIRLRFGGGHGRRRRIGLQYRKSLANQLAPRYARNSAAAPPPPSPISISLSPVYLFLANPRSTMAQTTLANPSYSTLYIRMIE